MLVGLLRIQRSCVLGWGDVRDCLLRPVVLSTDINGYQSLNPSIDNLVPAPGFVSSTVFLVGFELKMTIEATYSGSVDRLRCCLGGILPHSGLKIQDSSLWL